MVYEARQSPKRNYILAILCVLLSILGFAAAGVIPTQSGSYPLVGWGIVGACFAAAALFVSRARNETVQIRIDERGVFAPSVGPRPIPWDQLSGMMIIRAGIQKVVRFELRDPSAFAAAHPVKWAGGALDRAAGFGHFGINITHYDRGLDELLAAIHHYRPDLIDGASRPGTFP